MYVPLSRMFATCQAGFVIYILFTELEIANFLIDDVMLSELHCDFHVHGKFLFLKNYRIV